MFAPFDKLADSKAESIIQARASFQGAFNSEKRALIAQQGKAVIEHQWQRDKAAADRAIAEANARVASAQEAAMKVAAAKKRETFFSLTKGFKIGGVRIW